MGESQWSGTGTSADPWVLKTAPLSSEYRMYRDDSSSPPLLVCQVGSTKLTYLARAIDDLHAELLQRGDWVVLGAADESKDAAPDTVEAWGRWEGNPVGGWYGRHYAVLGARTPELPACRSAMAGRAPVVWSGDGAGPPHVRCSDGAGRCTSVG